MGFFTSGGVCHSWPIRIDYSRKLCNNKHRVKSSNFYINNTDLIYSGLMVVSSKNQCSLWGYNNTNHFIKHSRHCQIMHLSSFVVTFGKILKREWPWGTTVKGNDFEINADSEGAIKVKHENHLKEDIKHICKWFSEWCCLSFFTSPLCICLLSKSSHTSSVSFPPCLDQV